MPAVRSATPTRGNCVLLSSCHELREAPMTPPTTGRLARRDFLRLGWTLGAGLVLPMGLSGCRDDTSLSAWPDETFVEPATLASADGVLDVTLTLAYLETTLAGKPVKLRSMFNSIPEPTLRVNAGDRLRVRVINQLPPNPPSSEAARHLRYPNSTN